MLWITKVLNFIMVKFYKFSCEHLRFDEMVNGQVTVTETFTTVTLEGRNRTMHRVSAVEEEEQATSVIGQFGNFW
ncbi:hypothetical protein L1987_01287 [Smallanthus sonchifolius]|uniref:Uncharacterized protein n=1 Tax=Smallanthus sonchifolius TaxID=185202 RepID=A0ACB9K4T1_9ASTR|nr:hypothetical protein L1987_01287 [Smallanthus sonchifolius]